MVKGNEINEMRAADYSPEKAGVGGSTPSLATIILKNLAESPCASPGRSQSASVCGVAENRSQHCPCRSHAVLADTLGITLQGQFNVEVQNAKGEILTANDLELVTVKN